MPHSPENNESNPDFLISGAYASPVEAGLMMYQALPFGATV